MRNNNVHEFSSLLRFLCASRIPLMAASFICYLPLVCCVCTPVWSSKDVGISEYVTVAQCV